MPFTCKVGDSFYLPDNNGRHRWIIITKANAAGYEVIVNFTDANNLDCPVIFALEIIIPLALELQFVVPKLR
jgi:hypothetical protein